GNNAITFSGGTTLTGVDVVTLNNTAPVTFTGVIGGGGGLNTLGSGQLDLTAANTYTGDTNISGGTVTLSGSGSLASSNVSVNVGGELVLDNTTTNSSNRLPDSVAL